jgi:transcriptional regulator with XRE-family HTH domain
MGRASRLRVKHLGKKLKAIREQLELSQVGMAKALSFPTIHPTNISGFETGKREPPYPVLLKYSRLAGVCPCVLVDDALKLTDIHCGKPIK